MRSPTSEIVELLASRYILYKNASEETTYFLPSLLFPDHNVAKESNDPTVLSGPFYSPILLCPSTEFCPLGSFSSHCCQLIQKRILGNWISAIGFVTEFAFMSSTAKRSCCTWSYVPCQLIWSFVFFLQSLSTLA